MTIAPILREKAPILASRVRRALKAQREMQEPRPHPESVRFEDLYARYLTFIARSLLRLGVTTASLDDASQDVFVVVLRHLDKFRPGSSERAWLFAIAVRVASDYRRARRRKPALAFDDELIAEDNESPLCRALRSETRTWLCRALSELDEDQREAFLLAELGDYTAPEISTALGVNLSTIYTRVRTGRMRLAAKLEGMQRDD